jgi:hypothetical protein
MVLRLGSFNVENLFKRAKALNTATWSEGEPVLIAFERFNALANRSVYTDTDKQAMLAALETLQVLVRTRAGSLRLNTEPFDAWALLRENRGDFLVQPASGDARIVASGRGDWIGWAELLTEIVDETAIRMTARVIDELAADVLGIVEAEDRPALVRMNGEPAQPARLHPAVGGAGRHRHRRRHLPQGPLGRPWQCQPASGLGDLPGDHGLGPRRLRPRRHLGRPRPVARSRRSPENRCAGA